MLSIMLCDSLWYILCAIIFIFELHNNKHKLIVYMQRSWKNRQFKKTTLKMISKCQSYGILKKSIKMNQDAMWLVEDGPHGDKCWEYKLSLMSKMFTNKKGITNKYGSGRSSVMTKGITKDMMA